MMTKRQQAFVRAMQTERDARIAAVSAGYTITSAAHAASRLLNHPVIARELARQRGVPATGVAPERAPLSQLLAAAHKR